MFKTFRENRRLVRDLRTADAVHMTQLDEISALKARAIKAETSLEESRQVVKMGSEEFAKLEALIREQTGADLLVNALRELGVIPQPEQPIDNFTNARHLQKQMAATRSGMYRPSLGSQLGGGKTDD